MTNRCPNRQISPIGKSGIFLLEQYPKNRGQLKCDTIFLYVPGELVNEHCWGYCFSVLTIIYQLWLHIGVISGLTASNSIISSKTKMLVQDPRSDLPVPEPRPKAFHFFHQLHQQSLLCRIYIVHNALPS